MKRILFILIGLIVLAIGGVIVMATLVPKDVYKQRIEEAASGALDREITLNGDVGLSFFPRIAASIEDVTVANAEGFDGEHMIKAGALRASVKWGPLLSRKVEVHEIAFVDADITLQRLADGSANWELGGESAAEETPDASPDTSEGGAGIDAGVDQARLVNASLTYSDAQAGTTYELREFNAEASVKALTLPLTAKGDGIFDGDAFSFDINLASPQALLDGVTTALDASLTTDFAKVSYDGEAALGDAPAIQGNFSLSADSIATLAAKAGIDPATLPVALPPLGSLRSDGNVSGPLDNLDIRFDTMKVDGDNIDVDFTGAVTVAEATTVDGNLAFNMTRSAATIDALGLDIAQAGVLQDATVSLNGQVGGATDALSLSGTDLSIKGPLVDASYKGAVSLAGDGRLDGNLSAASGQLRALAAAAGVELEPGTTLQSFDISGNTSGSFNNVSITGLDVTLDDITANGTLGFDLRGARPKITGDLSTGPVDFTPFLGAEPDPNAPKGWSKTPLALDSLKTVDADIQLSSPALTIDKVVLSDARLSARLNNGNLTTNIEQFNAFGGQWGGNIGLTTASGTPQLAMKLTGNSILMQDILQTFAGLDKLSGNGQFSLDITGNGASLYDIMNNLNGDFGASLANGALQGINIGQLLRSTTDLRASLASGSFDLGLSPGNSTDFTSFDSVLKVRNGVAQIELMQIFSSTFGANGLGQINLGQQNIDMALQIATDAAGLGQLSNVQVGNIGIPLKISGDWTSPSILPDTSALTNMLAGEAVNQVGSLVQDQIGGALGDTAGSAITGVLGSAFGGNNTQTPAPPQAPTSSGTTATAEAATPAAPQEPVTVEDVVEDAVEDAVSDALGGLFGRKKD